MTEHIVSDETTTVMINPDGTYSAVPYASAGENGQVYLSLNDLGIQNDGEEMVLIAADENMDMETLESLIASGAVTTVTDNGSAEYVQLGDQGVLDGTQLIEVGPDQMQFYDPNTKTYYGAPGMVQDGNGLFALTGGPPGGITYRCPSCPAMYSNANAFTKHMREKHFVKVYTCRQCEEFFETLSQLFLHARRSHVDPKKPKRNPDNYKFHCDQCNYMTNNGGTMEHHKRAHTGEKPFVCDVCNKRFAQKANMKTHRNRHIYRDKIFRCDTCNKAFSSYDIYLAHLRTREHELREHFAMMASSQLSLECLGCALTFDSIYNLNKHTRSCRIVRTLQTKFRCLPCNAYVSDVASLKAHVKAHEGSQIISCPVCGERGFPGFNQLNHHITRAHALKVNRRHVCRYCESTFEMKKDLDSHIRSMHADERNARQSRGAVGRLKCRYSHCEFTTNSIMLLDRHHDQHMRQEEDGDDGDPLPPARYAGTKKIRRPRGDKFGEVEEIYAPEEEEDGEEFDVEDDIDDDLAPVEDGTNVTRRTITLIKSQSVSHPGINGVPMIEEDDGEEMDADGSLRPSMGTTVALALKRHNPMVSVKRSARQQPLSLNNSATAAASLVAAVKTPVNRRLARARRLPAWYKDYDTDYLAGEEGSENAATAAIKAALPAGIELTDPSANADDDGVPTEEWNIVVYDDEEIPMAEQEGVDEITTHQGGED